MVKASKPIIPKSLKHIFQERILKEQVVESSLIKCGLLEPKLDENLNNINNEGELSRMSSQTKDQKEAVSEQSCI